MAIGMALFPCLSANRLDDSFACRFTVGNPPREGNQAIRLLRLLPVQALHVSEAEENTLNAIFAQLAVEASANIDRFSHQIIIAQLELLLNYSERFYQRQFITRNVVSHELLNRLDDLIGQYFKNGDLAHKGLPTVNYLAEKLHLSAGYLTGMLKSLIGLSTQQYLHKKLIDLAKEKLSTTSLSVSKISYELGFEQLQSFSRLFKIKTNLSPKEFRRSFNLIEPLLRHRTLSYLCDHEKIPPLFRRHEHRA